MQFKCNFDALQQASLEGDVKQVLHILRSRTFHPDATAAGCNRRTALHLAAEAGHEEVAQLLCEHGNADLEARDSCGSTPLLYAIFGRHFAMVELLLFLGSDPDAASFYRTTPLILASRLGDVAIAQGLLHAGARRPVPDICSWDALAYASECGHVAVTACLLAFGAKPMTSRYMSPNAAKTMVMAGYCNWEEVPRNCTGLEQAPLTVFRDQPEALPRLFRRLEPWVQLRGRFALLVLKCRAPGLEKKLRIKILHASLQPGEARDKNN